MARKDVGDLVAIQVESRGSEMRRGMAGQLDDEFRQVGLQDLEARPARAGLRPISSVVMDLALTTVWTPCSRATSRISRRAWAASRARSTRPPQAVTARARLSRSLSNWATASVLAPRAWRRQVSQRG